MSTEQKSSTALTTKSKNIPKGKPKAKAKRTEKIKFSIFDPLEIIIENLGFLAPEKTEMTDRTGMKIIFFRIPMYYQVADVKYHVILNMGNLFSFGVNENCDKKSGELTGYCMAFSMFNYKGGPSERQIAVVRKIDEIMEFAKKHVMSVKKECREGSMELHHLDKFSCVKWPKDDKTGEILVWGERGPTIYGKCLYWPEKDVEDDEGVVTTRPASMGTLFNHIPVKKPLPEVGTFEFEDIDPMPIDFTELLNNYCYSRPALHFEGAFIGSSAKSMQVKLKEVDVDPLPRQQGPMSLLHKNRKTSTANVIHGSDAISALMGTSDPSRPTSPFTITTQTPKNRSPSRENDGLDISFDDEPIPQLIVGKSGIKK